MDKARSERLDARVFQIAGVSVLASTMTILDATVVSVAQRTFVAEFGSSQAVVAWTMTGYTLALATVIPVTGWAADRFGTKRLFMGSVLAFTIGSLLCALAPNILLLVLFRALQGIGGGMLMPLGFMILTRAAGPARLGRVMAVLGIPMLLGPIGGPILGGWLIGSYGWKWIFVINLPIGLAAIALGAVVFPADRPASSQAFDLTGLLLLSPGLAIFLFGVSSIPSRGTVSDHHVLVPVLVGGLLIATFVVHARYRTEHPLIDLRLLNSRAVALANMTLLVFAIAFFGTGLLLPSFFQQVMYQTPMQSGVHLIPQGLGAMLTMPFAGALMDRRGPGKIVVFGIAVIAAGMGTFALGALRQAAYSPTLLAGLAITGMGTGCTMIPLSGAAMRALAPGDIAGGSTLISVNQQVGGSIGTALMSVILTNQFNSNQNIAAADKVETLQPHALSHAYAVVFVLAALLVASTSIPAALLPRNPTPAG